MCQLGTGVKESVAPDRNRVGRHSQVGGVKDFKRAVKRVVTRILTKLIPKTGMIVFKYAV